MRSAMERLYRLAYQKLELSILYLRCHIVERLEQVAEG